MPFSAIPHNSQLFLDFLFDFKKVSRFYPHAPSSAAILDYAQKLQFPRERSHRVAAVLERQNRSWGASEATLKSIDSLRNGAVACISGQQVGLFGGPFYSVLKAISALQLASELSAKGVPAVPMFWLATEDHDLPEIASATILEDSKLATLSTKGENNGGAPVGRLPLGDEITELVDRAVEAMGHGWVTDALRESYRPGETYGSAFARLFTRIFAGTGLILIDPLDDELHRIAQPIISEAAERADELDAALLARGKELHNAGYHEQVRVTPESTLLFSLEGNKRTVLHLAGEEFMIGAQRVPRAEVLNKIATHPEQYSANVLLRPVIQDYLFPTVTYFGGPAEIAYFAQAGVVYEKLLGRATPVMPRLSATIISQSLGHVLDRYRVGFADLFNGTERVCELLASRVLPAELQERIEEAHESLRQNLAHVKQSLQHLDPTLVDAAERSERKMFYQLSKIAGKAARAELRRNEQLTSDAHRIMTELLPHKVLQERVLPGIYFLAKYGRDLLPMLMQTASSHCPGHQIVTV